MMKDDSKDNDDDKQSAASNKAARKMIAHIENRSSSSEQDTPRTQKSDDDNNSNFIARSVAAHDEDAPESVNDNPKGVRSGDDLPKKTHKVSWSSSSSLDDDDDDLIQHIIKQRLASQEPIVGISARNTTRESIQTEEISPEDTERSEQTRQEHVGSTSPSVATSPEEQPYPQNNIQQTVTLNEPMELLVEATPVVSRRRKHDDEAVAVPNVPLAEGRAENSTRSWTLAFFATVAVASAIILGVLIPRRKGSDEKVPQMIIPTVSPTISRQPSEMPSLAPTLSIMPSFSPTMVPSLSPTFGPRPPIQSGAELRSAIQSYLQEGGVNSSAAFEFGYPIGSWNVSQVLDFSFAFSQQESFNEDLSLWDTSNALNVSFMFEGAQAFNRPIGEWIVSRVTTMESMFNSAAKFNQFLGDWDVSAVTNMAGLFQGASSFNTPIGQWNTAKVVSMIAS
eukprot:scaffold1697_cov180-Amphora_coffeaeformis.AAC.4